MIDPTPETLAFLTGIVPAGRMDFFMEKCRMFADILYETNKTMNLTRIPPEEFWSKHAADSLALAKFVPLRKQKLCDVGCGAGFPSVILACAFPELLVTAIDSTRKKADFVAKACEKLGLDNLEAIQARANELGHKEDYSSAYDLVTARAVSAAAPLVIECSGLMKNSGTLCVYRAPEQASQEIPDLAHKHIHFRKTPEFTLPDNAGTRLFLLIARPRE